MKVKDREMNIYTGPGRMFYEFYLVDQSPLVGSPGRKSYLRRVTSDAAPGEVIEFALIEDLFVPNKVLVFPDYDNLRQELKDVVVHLIKERSDLKATVIVPLINKNKLGKTLVEIADIVYVSESAAIKASIAYVKGIFDDRGIAASRDVIELLTFQSADDPHTLITEVEKITVAFSQSKKVTVEELTKLSVVRTEFEIFRILREITRGKAQRGITQLYRYIDTIEESELTRVLGALQWSLKNEYVRAKGKDAKRRLVKLLFLAGDIDSKIKGESRLTPRDTFKNTLVYMADIVSH